MSNGVATKRYAQALFAIGHSLGRESLYSIGQGLSAVKACIAASGELADFLGNPIFSVEEKQKVMSTLAGTLALNDVVKNFCLLLAEKGRLACLQGIADTYSAMQDEEEGILRGEMITAVELSGERQEEVKNKLETQTGKKISLAFSVDPEIIGGLILKVGGKMLDASLRAQINILRENIKRGK